MNERGGGAVVVGFGNPHRRDDGVGPLVAATLRDRGVAALDVRGDGLALADAVRGARAVIVVDAMRSGRAPGTIVSLDLDAIAADRGAFPASSHVFGAAEGLELARRLRWLPRDTVLLGVEGCDFSHGDSLTAPVAAAVPELVALVERLAGATARGPRGPSPEHPPERPTGRSPGVES